MRLMISDFELKINKRYDQADYIPRVGDRIVTKEGNWRVVDVAWMYDLNCPNVTVTVEEVEFHGYYASLGNGDMGTREEYERRCGPGKGYHKPCGCKDADCA